MSANDIYFQTTGFNIAFTGKDADPWPRGLYAVDAEAAAWDGSTRRFALYSERHDVYSYCSVRITGRRILWNGNYRLTVRVDFDGESGENHAAIMLRPDGRAFDMAEARHVLAIRGDIKGTPVFNAEPNDPSQAGRKASIRYALRDPFHMVALHTRFDAVQWFVMRDDEMGDPDAVIVRQDDDPQQAAADFLEEA